VSSSCWDDVGFVDEVLDWLGERLCLDLDRVHVSVRAAWGRSRGCHGGSPCVSVSVVCGRHVGAHRRRPFVRAGQGLSNGATSMDG
jgi:hypothetical protein